MRLALHFGLEDASRFLGYVRLRQDALAREPWLVLVLAVAHRALRQSTSKPRAIPSPDTGGSAAHPSGHICGSRRVIPWAIGHSVGSTS